MSELVERLRHWMPIDLEDARWMRNAAADRIEALETALREAKQLATEANDALYGPQGYFHSLNGGPLNMYHFAEGIETLKACHEYFEKRSSVPWSDPLRAQVRDAIRRITTAE